MNEGGGAIDRVAIALRCAFLVVGPAPRHRAARVSC